MGTNSILSNLKKETAISQIKLSLGADIERKSVHLVVEGQDDVNVMKKFCDADTVIIESYSGKQGVEDIIKSKVIEDVRVIGIRDRDYCEKSNYDRLFFYDNCCLEMMILSFDEIFDSLYCEFYRGKMSSNELKNLIFEELYKVSKVRKYNEEKNMGINFNGLNFGKLINEEGKLELAVFIKKLEEINSGKKHDDYNEIWNKLEIESKEEYFDITNGHDFLFYFKALCDKNRDKKTVVGKNEIPSSLRVSFIKSHFKQTELYRCLDNYCKMKELNLWD